MRLYVSDGGNWGVINEDPFGFAIVKCDDFTEDHLNQMDWASDNQKLITALAIRRQIDDDNKVATGKWQDVSDLVDTLMKIAREQDSAELQALATKLKEGLGL